MARTPGPKLTRLQEAGFTIKFPLPEEYERVIEDLEDDELNLLIEIKQRIADAEATTAMPPFREYVLAPPL